MASSAFPPDGPYEFLEGLPRLAEGDDESSNVSDPGSLALYGFYLIILLHLVYLLFRMSRVPDNGTEHPADVYLAYMVPHRSEYRADHYWSYRFFLTPFGRRRWRMYAVVTVVAEVVLLVGAAALAGYKVTGASSLADVFTWSIPLGIFAMCFALMGGLVLLAVTFTNWMASRTGFVEGRPGHSRHGDSFSVQWGKTVKRTWDGERGWQRRTHGPGDPEFEAEYDRIMAPPKDGP